jgi:hypothetical protein
VCLFSRTIKIFKTQYRLSNSQIVCFTICSIRLVANFSDVMLLWKLLNTDNFHNKPETTVCICIEYRMISRGLPTMAEPSTAILKLNNFDNIVLGTMKYSTWRSIYKTVLCFEYFYSSGKKTHVYIYDCGFHELCRF